MDIEVSPPALAAAADTWDRLADQGQALIKRLRSADDESPALGVEVDAAAHSFIAAWVREAEHRVRNAKSNAHLLRRASRDYVAMDDDAVTLLRTLMPWRSPMDQVTTPFPLPTSRSTR